MLTFVQISFVVHDLVVGCFPVTHIIAVSDVCVCVCVCVQVDHTRKQELSPRLQNPHRRVGVLVCAIIPVCLFFPVLFFSIPYWFLFQQLKKLNKNCNESLWPPAHLKICKHNLFLYVSVATKSHSLPKNLWNVLQYISLAMLCKGCL